MGVQMRAFRLIVLVWAGVALSQPAFAGYDDLSGGQRAGYTALAVVQNVVPVASTLATPRCLQGYIACKFGFASISLLVAGESLLMSGGADLDHTRAILHRGFAGDWYVTGRHAAGDLQPQVLPDPGPPAPSSDATTP